MMQWLAQLNPIQVLLGVFGLALAVYMLVRVGSAAYYKSKSDYDRTSSR